MSSVLLRGYTVQCSAAHVGQTEDRHSFRLLGQFGLKIIDTLDSLRVSTSQQLSDLPASKPCDLQRNQHEKNRKQSLGYRRAGFVSCPEMDLDYWGKYSRINKHVYDKAACHGYSAPNRVGNALRKTPDVSGPRQQQCTVRTLHLASRVKVQANLHRYYILCLPIFAIVNAYEGRNLQNTVLLGWL